MRSDRKKIWKKDFSEGYGHSSYQNLLEKSSKIPRTMFIAIIFATACLLLVFLEERQEKPKIAPELLKKMFWVETSDYKICYKPTAKTATEEPKTSKKEAKQITTKSLKPKDEVLPIYLGIGSHDNKEYRTDLVKLPHLLVAGASGQGKSNFLNNVITGFSKLPKKLINMHLVDIKDLEFRDYENLVNTAVYNNAPSCIEMLRTQKEEMMKRLRTLKVNKCKSVLEFNNRYKNTLPFTIIVLDEFASISTNKKEKEVFESLLKFFSNVGRAAGVHLILATQRPDAKVITGQIRANMGGIVAFRVANATNSRVVLGQKGAENLKEKGRCLFQSGVDLIEIQTPKFKEK